MRVCGLQFTILVLRAVMWICPAKELATGAAGLLPGDALSIAWAVPKVKVCSWCWPFTVETKPWNVVHVRLEYSI